MKNITFAQKAGGAVVRFKNLIGVCSVAFATLGMVATTSVVPVKANASTSSFSAFMAYVMQSGTNLNVRWVAGGLNSAQVSIRNQGGFQGSLSGAPSYDANGNLVVTASGFFTNTSWVRTPATLVLTASPSGATSAGYTIEIRTSGIQASRIISAAGYLYTE